MVHRHTLLATGHGLSKLTEHRMQKSLATLILEGKNYFACSTCVATHCAVKDVRMVVTKITETEFSIQEKASDDGMQQ